MDDKDAYRIDHDSDDHEGDLLHDYTGVQYVVNDQYMERQIERRHNSVEKDIALNIAAQLLRSNLTQLTDRQKEVIIKTMEGKSLRAIAKEMKLNHNTVNEHLIAAREKLAGLINQTKGVLSNGTIDINKTDVDCEEGDF